ncbi:UAA transporter [Coprinopsis sp. MPI-PUGE-AT-0042]|nr:UAA transporter [Coprinopsis sp. MPI-PUGE-AT-0042]
MLFVTLQCLPSFLHWPEGSSIPCLKPRQVPLRKWLTMVGFLTTGSLLNNWAIAYKVPVPVWIVFRSAGLPASLLFGFLLLKRTYSWLQMGSVAIVTAGAFLAALAGSSWSANFNPADMTLYMIGITMLVASLVCTATLGVLQERTYRSHEGAWKEGLFYTHFLSLPIFLPLIPDIKQGLISLHEAAETQATIDGTAIPYLPYIILAANLISQYVCVTGVNQLASRVSSVSTNIALTVRKALSLILSVWIFGNAWNLQLGLGAGLVFAGSFLYTGISR